MCLADYCDIIRCDVLLTQDPKSVYPDSENTGIEIWREASSYSNKALVTSGPRDVAKYNLKNTEDAPPTKTSDSSNYCQKPESPDGTNGKHTN